MGWLKYIRVVLAVIVITLVTFSLVCRTGFFNYYGAWLEGIQFVPAIIAHSTFTIVALLLFTFVFGRLYCSVICPLGIYMDICSRGAKTVFKKLRPYRWIRPYNLLRYSILAAGIATVIFGILGFVSLLDPYKLYGWVSANILHMFTGRIFHNDMVLVAIGASISFLWFLTITLFAIYGGRTWCNTACPVGALLSIFGKHSILRIRIDNLKCTSCGECEKKCKATCISAQMKYVDTSRCVSCYNCLGTCKYGALTYSAGQKDSLEDTVKE